MYILRAYLNFLFLLTVPIPCFKANDIWLPFRPRPGDDMSDCDGSSCDGRYLWGDGSAYDHGAADAIRVVQNERDPCFRLMVGDAQINDNPCTNNFAVVCAYHCE